VRGIVYLGSPRLKRQWDSRSKEWREALVSSESDTRSCCRETGHHVTTRPSYGWRRRVAEMRSSCSKRGRWLWRCELPRVLRARVAGATPENATRRCVPVARGLFGLAAAAERHAIRVSKGARPLTGIPPGDPESSGQRRSLGDGDSGQVGIESDPSYGAPPPTTAGWPYGRSPTGNGR